VEEKLLMVKRILTLFAACSLFFLAACGDDGNSLSAATTDGSDSSSTTEGTTATTEDTSTSTTEGTTETTGGSPDGKPFTYGDDPDFDALWDACDEGNGAACDELFWTSPSDSDYEHFGNTCGERFDDDEVPFSCEDELGGEKIDESTTDGSSYGDDPTLDALWDACDEGDGQACDDLYWGSPVGSEYEAFGNTCGERFSEDEAPFSCADEIGGGDSGSSDDAFTYGDDPALDALWDACDGGDPDACDELFYQSPSGSEYEDFGFSCGGRVPEDEIQVCSEVM
jgi:hypothetical protein